MLSSAKIVIPLALASVIAAVWWGTTSSPATLEKASAVIGMSGAVNEGLSKAFSFDTASGRISPSTPQEDVYKAKLHAPPLIKSMECGAPDGDNMRFCKVLLSTDNHAYYLRRDGNSGPISIQMNISLSVSDVGGLPSKFNYVLDADAQYETRVVDYRSGQLMPAQKVTDFLGFDGRVSISGIDLNPAKVPLSNLIAPLETSLRNVSKAVMSTTRAAKFVRDVERVIEADANITSYR